MLGRNRLPNSRGIGIGLLLLLLALVLGWLREAAETPVERRIPAPHTPDYWVEGLSAQVLDATGHPRYRLQAAALQHFPDDDSAELTQARLELRTATGGVPWRLHAATGWISQNGAELLLKGGVTLDQDGSDTTAPTHLETPELRVLPKQNYAETGQPVAATHGASWVQAVGMQAWLQAPARIKLLANVRGHYEFTPP